MSYASHLLTSKYIIESLCIHQIVIGVDVSLEWQHYRNGSKTRSRPACGEHTPCHPCCQSAPHLRPCDPHRHTSHLQPVTRRNIAYGMKISRKNQNRRKSLQPHEMATLSILFLYWYHTPNYFLVKSKSQMLTEYLHFFLVF